MTDLERLRGKEECEGRQRGGEEWRWWSELGLLGPGEFAPNKGSWLVSKAGPDDGGSDGDRVAAGVCDLSGKT